MMSRLASIACADCRNNPCEDAHSHRQIRITGITLMRARVVPTACRRGSWPRAGEALARSVVPSAADIRYGSVPSHQAGYQPGGNLFRKRSTCSVPSRSIPISISMGWAVLSS